MKKFLLCLTLVGLLVFALGGTAGAQPPTLKSLATTVAGTGPGTFGSAWATLGDTSTPTVGLGTYPVKLQCYLKQRQSNGTYRWVLRKTVSARAADSSTYTKVTGKFSLPNAGKWRIRAYHAADSKNAATYSSYRYLSVR